MQETKNNLKVPPSHKGECVEIFNHILSAAPYYGQFHCGHLLGGGLQDKKVQEIINRCHPLSTRDDLENDYNVFLLKNGYAKNCKLPHSYWLEFTRKGRRLKRSGSFEEYEKRVITKRGTKKAIRRLSVEVPQNQLQTNKSTERTNWILVRVFIATLIVSCVSLVVNVRIMYDNREAKELNTRLKYKDTLIEMQSRQIDRMLREKDFQKTKPLNPRTF